LLYKIILRKYWVWEHKSINSKKLRTNLEILVWKGSSGSVLENTQTVLVGSNRSETVLEDLRQFRGSQQVLEDLRQFRESQTVLENIRQF